MSERVLRKLPNWLTLLRLALIPVFVVLLVDPSNWMVSLATFVFIVAALTDYIDGYLARRFGATTDIGKLFDPLADKILVLSALVMLVSLRSDVTGAPWVPGWLVVLVLAREVWVTGLRGIAASRGLVLEASSTGKFKSVLQMVAIVLLLLHGQRLTFFGIAFTGELLGANLLLLSVVVSYWAAVDYSVRVFREALSSNG